MTKMRVFWILTLFAFSSGVFAVQKVKIKKTGVYIYAKEEGDAKIAVMEGDEEAFLLQRGKQRSKIKATGGFVGWTVNSEMEFIAQDKKGSVFNLDELEVKGWLDNPAAIYILDQGNMGAEGMLISRDFHHEIFEFIDREEIERNNDEN